jgi:hypothetical protein
MVITLHFVSRLVIYQRVANATESNTNVTNTVKEGEEGEPTIIALPNDQLCLSRWTPTSTAKTNSQDRHKIHNQILTISLPHKNCDSITE